MVSKRGSVRERLDVEVFFLQRPTEVVKRQAAFSARRGLF